MHALSRRELELGSGVRLGPSSPPEVWTRFRDPTFDTLGGQRVRVFVRPTERDGTTVPSMVVLELAPPGGSLFGEHPLERNWRHFAILERALGRAPWRGTRGLVYAFDWGWLYACRGEIRHVYRGPKEPVPLPGTGADREPADFACLACRRVVTLPYGDDVFEATSDRGVVPCEGCGSLGMARVGALGEMPRVSRRIGLCEVGGHRAEGVDSFDLVDRTGAETLVVKACPAHVEVLAAGYRGFVLAPR